MSVMQVSRFKTYREANSVQHTCPKHGARLMRSFGDTKLNKKDRLQVVSGECRNHFSTGALLLVSYKETIMQVGPWEAHGMTLTCIARARASAQQILAKSKAAVGLCWHKNLCERIWGFPKIRGTLLGVLIIRINYSIWGSILGFPHFGKLPYDSFPK